jgi:electron transfer flavoprotein alpha subunit
MKVLVFCEQRAGKLKPSAFEALTAASTLAGGQSAQVCAVLIGAQMGDLPAELKGWGCDEVLVYDTAALGLYNPMSYSQAMSDAVKNTNPNVVIGIASPMGRDIFPRLAARHSAPLLTDLITLESNGMRGVKPMYAGKVLATCSFTANVLRFVTLRPNVTTPNKSGNGNANVKAMSLSLTASTLKTVEIKKGEVEQADLTEATRIISGGRALGSSDNFAVLQSCAQVLGATVGASRAAVDAGYARHDMQVGQTGKTVNPNLYIACGISGSIQHMAGMRTSKIIVAVNTDREAPIFSIASYGIVGDLFKVVPMMTEKLKKTISE